MVECPSCGRENPDGFLHCGYCGAPLTVPAAPRRRLATLVFCDLVGSTALGERVDPESLQELMRLYFAEMRTALEGHGGTVQKFIGDAVVGVFGVPAAREDDALRACRAALEMQERVAALNPQLWECFHTEIAVRIGVNSGEVVGSEETFVTGDAVNAAARLEQAAGPGEVLLGETTLRLVRAAVRVDEIGPLAAKGKAEPLPAYRLLEVGQVIRQAVAPLVGRRAELALLDEERRAALSEPRCRVVTVVGEPGVGKSRLAAELFRRVDGEARVVRGACLSYGEGITFWAIAQVVRALAGITDEDTAEAARARVPKRIAQLIGLADGATTAEQTADAVASFLAAAGSLQPLVVLVDDIQWAEPALLDLLAGLPARVGAVPILLLCLARPELLESRPDWPVTVRLEPLGAAEVDELLDRLEAPAAVRVRVAQAAGGNPLYAEELVAWVREGGALDEMPTTLNALLGARLDRLGTEERDALERGAVEGELFHQAAIVELSDEQARAGVPGELGQLERKDLIRLAAASLFTGGVAYRFKHILVRDAAYRATAKRVRADLHERFANWLELLARERVAEYHEILGYHLEQAYRYREELGTIDEPARLLAARAGHHLGAAGGRARGRGDHRAVLTLVARALALLPTDDIEYARALRLYGRSENSLGRRAEGRAKYERVVELATALGDRDLATRARADIMDQRLFREPDVDLAACRAEVEAGLETMTELRNEVGIASHERLLAFIARREGCHAEANRWMESALRRAAACDEQGLLQGICAVVAGVLVNGTAAVPDAIARCEDLSRAHRDDRLIGVEFGGCLAALHAMAGRSDESRLYLEAADAVSGSVDTNFTALRRPMIATALELMGDLDGAERAHEAKWRFFGGGSAGEIDGRAVDAAVSLARLCCDRGRWDAAAAWLAPYRDVPRTRRYLDPPGYRLAVEARLAARSGDHARAVAWASRAVRESEESEYLNGRAQVWLALAEVQRAAGSSSEADAATARALELYVQKGNVAAAERVRATLSAGVVA